MVYRSIIVPLSDVSWFVCMLGELPHLRLQLHNFRQENLFMQSSSLLRQSADKPMNRLGIAISQ